MQQLLLLRTRCHGLPVDMRQWCKGGRQGLRAVSVDCECRLCVVMQLCKKVDENAEAERLSRCATQPFMLQQCCSRTGWRYKAIVDAIRNSNSRHQTAMGFVTQLTGDQQGWCNLDTEDV